MTRVPFICSSRGNEPFKNLFSQFEAFLNPVFRPAGVPEMEMVAHGSESAAHSLEITLAAVAVFAALIGLLAAFWLYLKQPGKAERIAKSLDGIYTTVFNKYYVDELYAAVIVRPLLWISTNILWKTADVALIDGTVNGIADGTTAIGDGVRHTQSGNTRSYAVWVVIGAVVIMAVIFWPLWKPPIEAVR